MKDEQEIYEEILGRLRSLMESHVSGPNKRGSIRAFCEAYGISRQNLTDIFAGNQIMSLGLFMRITTALGLSTSPGSDDKEVSQLNLRLYLKTQPRPMLDMLVIALS